MTMQFTEQTRAVWYQELANDAGNWIAMVSTLENGRCKLEYRFRYYVDHDRRAAPNSQDERRGASFEADDITQVITKVREAIKNAKTHFGAGKSWELLRGAGSFEDFMAQFMALPFVHATTEKLTP